MIDQAKRTLGPRPWTIEEYKRAVVCVNAMQNVPDPAAWVEAVERLRKTAEVVSERIAYYASYVPDEVINIEDWGYTDNSGDIQKFREALAALPAPTTTERKSDVRSHEKA